MFFLRLCHSIVRSLNGHRFRKTVNRTRWPQAAWRSC